MALILLASVRISVKKHKISKRILQVLRINERIK